VARKKETKMTMTRRMLLSGFAACLVAVGDGVCRRVSAQDVGQWFPLVGDDGRPVANTRLPVELTSEAEDLPGAIWLGSERRDFMLVEFYDYNCPWCRKAVADIHELMRATPELRVGLVNNPILSPGSVEAAKVELALTRLGRPESVYRFHQGLFEKRGPVNGARALEVAGELGAPRAKVEELARSPEIADDLKMQTRLASSLGFAATPSFLIAGAGVLGYPGPTALARVLDEVRRCDRIAC
jgi:protein-disulfide isomerase